jgi:CD109 antigen
MIGKKYDKGEILISFSRWKSILLLLATALFYDPKVAEAGQVGPVGPTSPTSTPGTYAVVAPSQMRPGTPFRCSLTLFSGARPVTFNLRLQQINSNVPLVSGSDTLTAISQPMTRSLTLQIPSYVPQGIYYLFVEGSGGQTFSQSKYVTLAYKQLSIFIQTDKDLYKPGQTVLFRCIAVYPNLLPYKNEINVTVYDQGNNKIKQSLNVKSTNGVIEQQLKLADQTPLGKWRIECTAGGNQEIREFTVAEYVLPKFEVSVLTPSFYLVNLNQPSLQKDLDITVKVMYTYGQPLQKGVANISVQIQPYSYESFTYPVRIYQAQVVNGASQIKVSTNDLVALLPASSGWESADQRIRLSGRIVQIKASVLENVTGVTLSGETTVPCTTYRYRLQFMDITQTTFRRGMDFTGYLRLSQFDGTPPLLDDFKNKSTGRYPSIKVTVTMYSYLSSPQYMSYTIDKTVEVQLTPSGYQFFTMKLDSNCTSVTLRADLLDPGSGSSLTDSRYLNPFNTRDNAAGIKIKVSGSDGTIQPNSVRTFTVTTSTATKTIYYQILGKGQIVTSESVSSVTAITERNVYVSITPLLAQTVAPAMTLVVWYVTDSQEIVADSIKLTVSGGFANQVSLTFDQVKVKPGDNVTLTVNSCPGSFVGILAVDQSVILLQPGNRFTQDSVSSDLEEYAPYSYSGYGYPAPPPPPGVGPRPPSPPSGPGPAPLPGPAGSSGAPGSSSGQRPLGGPMRRKRSVVPYPWGCYSLGGTDSTQVLNSAGVILITDGYIYQYSYNYYPGMPGIVGAPGAAGASGPQGQPGPSGPVGAPGNTPNSNSGSNEPPSVQKTRSNFQETFLWTSMTAGPNKSVKITAQVPDTITSWVASAFAVDDKCGLGVADVDAKLTVFQTFFISVTSPYSVVRGEEFAYLVTVFNYFNQSLTVTVTLKKSSDFMVRTGRNSAPQSVDVTMTINVPSNDAVTVYYWIVPKTLGQIPILVQAQSSAAADAMRSLLLVKPEGVEQSYSTSVLIQLPTNGQTYSSTFNTTLPPNGVVVPGSQRITCTAIGDIMGPSIQGLDKLIQLPTGCGEQNMVTMAPMVSVVKYLTATGQLTQELKDKALSYMNTGYQRELTYQHNVGSFSAFGEKSGSVGSTWLTAFVLRIFRQAKQYIPVEDDKMAKTMTWIMDQQNSDGSFKELGTLLNSNLPGGSAKGAAMTAYVLIAMCLNKDNSMINRVKYQNSVNSGTAFLLTQINSLNSDPYTLSIAIYALQTCGVSGWESAFQTLKNKAITEGGKTHWEQLPSDPTGPVGVAGLSGVSAPWTPPYLQSPSRNIELTSYVFLIMAPRKNISEYVPVCKWLVSQRNSLGGYSNTQDTVMALEALSECALLLYGNSSDGSGLNVACTGETFNYAFQPITKTNALVLQQIELPQSTTNVGIRASGKGTALVQVNVKYNVYNVQNNNGIVLYVGTTSTGNQLSVVTCSSWTGSAASGMCLLEVNILTGYQITNLDTIKNQGSGSVDRIESDKEKIVLYYNQLTKTPICRTITMRPDQMVNNVQRALVKLYRYYDKDSIKSTFYQPTNSTTDDHCVTCPQCCRVQVGKK